MCIIIVSAVIGGINEDNNRHEQEMKQLEIKQLELQRELITIKLKQK